MSTATCKTLEHLLLHCPFAINCWKLLHLHIVQGDPFAILQAFRAQLNKTFFMDIIILMSWCIWMARNDLIFKGLQPNLQSVRERFKTEIALVLLRAKPRFQQDMSSWIDTTLQTIRTKKSHCSSEFRQLVI
jgi:hypothetical protein